MARRGLLRVTGRDPEQVRNDLIELSTGVAVTYGDVASSTAAEWYEQDRGRYVAGQYTAIAPALTVAGIAGTVRWAVSPLFEGLDSIHEDELLNAVETFVDDSARETIVHNATRDRANYGFYRIPEPAACDFCLMLSHRGAVYRKDTVDFASHTNCKCRIGNVYEPGAPEASVAQYEVSRRLQPRRRRRKESHEEYQARSAADIERYRRTRRGYVENWIENNRGALDAMRSEL